MRCCPTPLNPMCCCPGLSYAVALQVSTDDYVHGVRISHIVPGGPVANAGKKILGLCS